MKEIGIHDEILIRIKRIEEHLGLKEYPAKFQERSSTTTSGVENAMGNHDNPRRNEAKINDYLRRTTMVRYSGTYAYPLITTGPMEEPVEDDDYESMTDDDLEDAVHEAKGDEAADINNAGRDAQTGDN